MYRNLRHALQDLEHAGMLKRIHDEVDPYLEMAEIARQAYECGGPALLFEKVKGCRFQAAANIFGTMDRMRFLFRDTLESTKTAIDFKSDPVKFFKGAGTGTLLRAAKAGLNSLPVRSGSLRDFEECSLADLPQIVGWPEDGGAFITLPQVATRPCEKGGILKTNLGMYRVQISGNDYAPDECGLHYQINRDIAAHHQKAIDEGRPLKVSIFIGGSPAHTVAAVTPMPANLSELTLAGMLAGRRFRYFEHDGYLVSSDAEFCILGEMAPDLKPEGPFGDHIGYYSGRHDFPYLKVKKVLCKKNAIYPFTVVGRPPKEDTVFGEFIHEITRPMVPTSLPGVHAVHAVDEAGVHPLCLALASERFRPYAGEAEREPMELLKTANALLGFNQVSLAKYLLLAAREDDAALDVNNVPGFFAHVLERVDFARDLHLQTATTIDTLDYSGTSLNHGSKLVMAAAGKKRRELRCNEGDLTTLALPEKFANSRIAMKGVLAVQWKGGNTHSPADFDSLRESFARWEYRENYPWVSVVDDTQSICTDKHGLADFLWMTFTRSDPAQDLYGVAEHYSNKHWAIDAPLIVDARIKAHHQKPLAINEGIVRKAKKFLGSLGLALAVAVVGGFATGANAAGHCATSKILEHRRHAATVKVSARKDIDGCGPEVFYDSVYTRTTPHFQIFYTLKGVHATTEKYIDSAAVDFEKAWELHVGKRGMRAPESDSVSHHYQKKAEKGHYIVEVVDLLKVRERYSVMGNECTGGCFGITHPASDPHKTQIFIENDFKYSTDNGNTASIDVDGTTCYYDVSETPITTYSTELVDYSREWAKAIRVTAFHELYHAVQLRYINYNQFSTFWLEASAAGVEEVAAPDVNDYIHYISSMLNNSGTSMEVGSYDAGLFYIYLYNHFNENFDKSIWEGFAKDPTKNFTAQFSNVVKAKKMSPDSVFHDFAERLSFSGSRSKYLDTSAWIGIDQPLWPDAAMFKANGTAPDVQNLAYQYYSGVDINLDNFVGKASAIQYKGGNVSFYPIANTASIDSIRIMANRNDSTVWILSRMNQTGYIPEVVKDSTLRAFPTPWRHGNLCFTPLPLNKKFIEIRNARGDLVMREKYTHTTHCIDEATVMDKMKPGVYRFRAGASGKTEKFLIVY